MTIKEILQECKERAIKAKKRYDFWIICENEHNDEAEKDWDYDDYNYEGGHEISLDSEFRNTFSFDADGNFHINFDENTEDFNKMIKNNVIQMQA